MIIHLPYALYITSLIAAFFLFPIFIQILEKNHILDSPNERKIHSVQTPSMGGVPIFFSCLFALIIWLPGAIALEFKYLFSSLSIMFLVGLRDDLIPLSPRTKILSQLIPILIFVYLSEQHIHSLYEIYDVELGATLSFFLTSFFLLSFSNSLNLIDGIDGLAGSISLLILTFFGFWFAFTEDTTYSFLSFCAAGGLTSFLIFNWQPSKIFLGDTGALLLGLLIAYLGIVFLNTNEALPTSSWIKYKSPLASCVAILIIPIMDTIRVIIVRLLNRKSPLQADKNHLHHLLLESGLSHSKASLTLVLFNLIFIGLTFLTRKIHPIMSWLLLVSMSLAAMWSIVRFKEYYSKSFTKKSRV
ncbi:MAG: MraY family glycosyltransferase [Bacteroidota bacterium]